MQKFVLALKAFNDSSRKNLEDFGIQKTELGFYKDKDDKNLHALILWRTVEAYLIRYAKFTPPYKEWVKSYLSKMLSQASTEVLNLEYTTFAQQHINAGAINYSNVKQHLKTIIEKYRHQDTDITNDSDKKALIKDLCDFNIIVECAKAYTAVKSISLAKYGHNTEGLNDFMKQVYKLITDIDGSVEYFADSLPSLFDSRPDDFTL